MEDAQHKNPQQALRSFDGRLAAGVEALKRSGRWDSILQAGGSSRGSLGQPSPPVQVSHGRLQVQLSCYFLPVTCNALRTVWNQLQWGEKLKELLRRL